GAGHDGRRVDHREAGGAARLHRLLEALLGGGDEGAADRPADDGALELEAAAAGERLEVDDAHAELAVAAGLLLVATLDAGDAAGDSLPVGAPLHLSSDETTTALTTRENRVIR